MAAPTTATAMVRKITARLKLFTRLTIWLKSKLPGTKRHIGLDFGKGLVFI
jgi:hypothetical protein